MPKRLAYRQRQANEGDCMGQHGVYPHYQNDIDISQATYLNYDLAVVLSRHRGPD